MADEGDATPTRGRRLRGVRNKLKKSQEIDRVVVEKAFQLNDPTDPTNDGSGGGGCYVSATVHNRRYYGVLVEQGALQSATHLFFKDEASGLDLNRRMQAMLFSNGHANNSMGGNENGNGQGSKKRQRLDSNTASAAQTSLQLSSAEQRRQVQKFRFVPAGTSGSTDGYRELLATFASIEAAGEDDLDLAKEIQTACRAGGKFVKKYYYQFEAEHSTLSVAGDSNSEVGVRMSMGIDNFLQITKLPPWYPLSNLEGSQQKVLDMLKMKKDGSGKVVVGKTTSSQLTNEELDELRLPDTVSMLPRSFAYRVVVIGGGIAGLSSCLELLRSSEREGLDLEVTLLEARDRLGGRLFTDRETFVDSAGTAFPVDLGASWIHGIDQNPLAALAKQAGIGFVRTSEEVTMLQAANVEVDKDLDDRAGDLFDKLLDLAADESWKNVEKGQKNRNKSQNAVRWYSSRLGKKGKTGAPPVIETPKHRRSSDISVDQAIGKAIAKFKEKGFSGLSEVERRMLKWNLKNVEYALGANISDLSMKFWDIDERHAFEGDHVILKEGYSAVVEHYTRELEKYGQRFTLKRNFSVGKVEYARTSVCQPYFAPTSRRTNLTPLSDACLVSSQDCKDSIACDFTICAVPLGVLKSSIQEVPSCGLEFLPDLPFSKSDAIESVGFGLLDKVYLQFDAAFWRKENDEATLYGNATGLHPHHYMFFDIGKAMTGMRNSPAILMSLVSGKEAVLCEQMSEDDVVSEAMEVLRRMFVSHEVTEPVKYRVTRWGSDKYSRGSYTFLPPGTTDQDFKTLQSAINGNGDSLLLQDEAEVMRLFFAGEHTTALHPSMAHGALLSGIRSAKEVIASITGTFFRSSSYDRMIPVSLFRHLNPEAPTSCSLCHREGTRIREGTLLAFKRGPYEVLVHNNCAENSPEVEVDDGKWKDVITACNRGKNIICYGCDQRGATIGCADESCGVSYHFSCAEDTGWRFEDDGKTFYCDYHRDPDNSSCNKISMHHYLQKTRRATLACALCRLPTDTGRKSVAFQQGTRRETFHADCLLYTTVVDTAPDNMSRFEDSFRNVFSAIQRSGVCAACGHNGASIGCGAASCSDLYHLHCAKATGWKPSKRRAYQCPSHRAQETANVAPRTTPQLPPSTGFQHALFSLPTAGGLNVPGNLDIQNPKNHRQESSDPESTSDEAEKSDTESATSDEQQLFENAPQDILTSNFPSDAISSNLLIRMHRPSLKSPWNVNLEATRVPETSVSVLSVSHVEGRTPANDGLVAGDIVLSMNGYAVGSKGLRSVQDVLAFLSKDTEFMVEVQRQES